VLEGAGLVDRRAEAQWRLCSLRGEGLREAAIWIESYREFWESSLDRLVDYLEKPKPRKGRKR
jgi:DNA-binding transcriptional ArsR family regulator